MNPSELLKDPNTIDGGRYGVEFRSDGLAFVTDCEGSNICLATRGVAVWLAMFLNWEEFHDCGFPEPQFMEADGIAAEMERNHETIPPEVFR